MYTVTVHHHTKAYRRGDLEDNLELIDSRNFKTRKAAKDFIERNISGKKNVWRRYHKGDEMSSCGYFTDVTWVNENTGEDMQEYYQYLLKKAKVY